MNEWSTSAYEWGVNWVQRAQHTSSVSGSGYRYGTFAETYDNNLKTAWYLSSSGRYVASDSIQSIHQWYKPVTIERVSGAMYGYCFLTTGGPYNAAYIYGEVALQDADGTWRNVWSAGGYAPAPAGGTYYYYAYFQGSIGDTYVDRASFSASSGVGIVGAYCYFYGWQGYSGNPTPGGNEGYYAYIYEIRASGPASYVATA